MQLLRIPENIKGILEDFLRFYSKSLENSKKTKKLALLHNTLHKKMIAITLNQN